MVFDKSIDYNRTELFQVNETTISVKFTLLQIRKEMERSRHLFSILQMIDIGKS